MSGRLEASILLAILGEDWGQVDRLVSESSPDAKDFLALCREADVGPGVHAALTRAGRPDVLGAEARDGLEAIRTKTRLDNLLLIGRLEQALDLLLGAGIRPVALKGADVLHRFYRAFDERALDDVDLLVPRAQRDLAIATLESAGFTAPAGSERDHWFRSSFELPMTSPGPIGVAFDIHWSLGQAKRYAIDPDEILQRAVPLSIGGREVLRLDDHDAVAHLLVHHVQHYFGRRLKWVVEVGMMAATPGFSWATVGSRLSGWGGRQAAGLALAHVRKLLPRMLPEAAYAAVPASPWRLLATLPLRSAHPLDFYRGSRSRTIQLVIAAAALERPWDLPAYLRHRAMRDRLPEDAA